jgi:hypothetical protein
MISRSSRVEWEFRKETMAARVSRLYSDLCAHEEALARSAA